MATNYSYGLAVNGVMVGDIEIDGGASLTLASVGQVVEDTININPGNNTDTDFTAQGESDPSITVTKKGVVEGTFDLMTLDPEVIADLTGGTTTGADPNKLYHSPAGVPNIEKTLKFIDSQGMGWLYPRCKINAQLVGQFRNGALNVVRVSFKVLTPKKAGVKSFTYGNPA